MRIWLLVSFALLLTGCESIEIDLGGEGPEVAAKLTNIVFHVVPQKVPCDLPPAMRGGNYGPSCMWASFQNALRWQHQEQVAAACRAHCYGPAGVHQVAAWSDAAGLDYAYTDCGNAAFLDWCSRTRRGAVVVYENGCHAILFCGYLGADAVLLDPNHPERLDRLPRDAFLKEWLRSGGCAITPLYAPTPPQPWM